MTLDLDNLEATALDLDNLEAAARAATPGPWEWNDTTRDNYERLKAPKAGSFEDERTVIFAAPCGYENSYVCIDGKDARFIAAANPSTVLALVQRIRSLEADAALRA